MFHISQTRKDSAELGVLVSELDAFQNTLYPAESNHLLDLTAINDESVRCVIVHDENGYPAGCGAIYLQGHASAEIKRMYIRPAYRGKKLGEEIIAYLERLAVVSDCRLLQLETGIHQQAAINLYQKCGYQLCEPFPPYKEDPLSVFMQKRLS